MQIRTKLLVSFLGLSAMVIVSVAFVSIQQIFDQSREYARVAALREMVQIDETVESVLDGVRRNVDFMAQDPGLTKLGEGVTDYLVTGGLVRPRSDDTAGLAVSDFLGKLAEANPLYQDVFVGTMSGGFLSGSVGLAVSDGYDPRGQLWFQQALEGSDRSQAYKDAGGRGACIARMRVIQGADGTLAGVAGVQISLASLTQRLVQAHVGDSGWLMLLQSDSVVLASPRDTALLSTKYLSAPPKDSVLEVHWLAGKPFYRICYTSPSSGWRYVGFIPRAEVLDPVWNVVYKILGAALLVFGLATLFAFWQGTRLSGPLAEVGAQLAEVAEGAANLTRRLSYTGNDEIGRLVQSFEKMQNSLQTIVKGVQEDSLVALTASRDASVALSEAEQKVASLVAGIAVADQTTRSARIHVEQVTEIIGVTDSKAQALAERGNGIQLALQTVAKDVQGLSLELGVVAGREERLESEMESMSETLDRLSSSIETTGAKTMEAQQVADNARQKAETTAQVMKSLEETAVRIGRMVELIQSIASQTNLLALNATIEAASAGDAGKGFAVVASEVKVLAKQTADATREIQQHVAAIQSDAKRSARSMGEVVNVISSVHEMNASIAMAVETQTTHASTILSDVCTLGQEVKALGVELRARAAHAEANCTVVEEKGSEASAVAQDILALASQIRSAMGDSSQMDAAMNNVSLQLDDLREAIRQTGDAFAGGNQHLGVVAQKNDSVRQRISLFVVD